MIDNGDRAYMRESQQLARYLRIIEFKSHGKDIMASNPKTVIDKVEIEAYIDRKALDKAFYRTGLCAYCQRRYSCCQTDSPGLVFECDDCLNCEDNSVGLTFSLLELSTEEPEYRGLCSECQDRSFCTLKDISGGVWHCDRYI